MSFAGKVGRRGKFTKIYEILNMTGYMSVDLLFCLYGNLESIIHLVDVKLMLVYWVLPEVGLKMGVLARKRKGAMSAQR